jgi:hypothetical protein
MEGRPIKTFVAECYRPGLTRDRAGALVSRLSAAAPAIEAPIQVVGWLLFAEDEVLFVLIRAMHQGDVLALTEVASFPLDRVAASVIATTLPICPPGPSRGRSPRSTS